MDRSIVVFLICGLPLFGAAETPIPTESASTALLVPTSPEQCRRLSGLGGSILGGFGTEAYAVGTHRFVNGVLNADSENKRVVKLEAPMREFSLSESSQEIIVMPDWYGQNKFGDVWVWTAPSVPGLSVHIRLPSMLLQGQTGEDSRDPDKSRQPFTQFQRTFLVNLIGESLAVLPQAVLASLPPIVHLIVVDDLNSVRISDTRLAAAAVFPEHHATEDRYSLLLSVKWATPIEGGFFFSPDYENHENYVGVAYHREVRFEELLLHEFAHLIDDFYRVTSGQYWLIRDGFGRWVQSPVARWWEFRQLERSERQEFVSGYAAINVKENFAETFTAWAILRSGRMNPYTFVGNACTLGEHIRTKMPQELDWWERQGTRALFSVDGSLFACEPFLDTDFDGIIRIDSRPETEDPAELPCADLADDLQ